MSRTITHEKKNKFSKSSFSREKTFAMSEQDIMKNEKKMNDFRMKRGAEPRHLIQITLIQIGSFILKK